MIIQPGRQNCLQLWGFALTSYSFEMNATRFQVRNPLASTLGPKILLTGFALERILCMIPSEGLTDLFINRSKFY